MAFQNAKVERFEEFYTPEGDPERLFVAVRIFDDVLSAGEDGESHYVEYWVEGPQLAALAALKNAGGGRNHTAQRNAFLAWMRPKIARSYQGWMAEVASRPVVERLTPTQVEETWGVASIDTLE